MRRGALIAAAILLAAGLALWLLSSGSQPVTSAPATTDAPLEHAPAASQLPTAAPTAAAKPASGAARATSLPASAPSDAAMVSSQPGRQRRSFLGQMIEDGLERAPDLRRQVRGWVAPVQVRIFFARNASLAQAQVDRYCEEARRLREYKLFDDVERTTDAGPYLASRVDWLNGPVGSLHLPESITQRIRTKEWQTALTPAELATFDFSWLRELARFDHWSLTQSGPFSDSYDFFNGPIPSYLNLADWGRLRLAAGQQQGDVRVAAAEVRHLGQLMHTSGFPTADAVAISLLILERRTWETAQVQGLDVTGWQTFEVDLLRQWQRAMLAEMNFFWPQVEPDVARRLWECSINPCAALVEGLAVRAGMRDVLGSGTDLPFPGLDTSRCDRALLDHSAKLNAFGALDAADAMGDATPLESWVAATPHL